MTMTKENARQYAVGIYEHLILGQGEHMVRDYMSRDVEAISKRAREIVKIKNDYEDYLENVGREENLGTIHLSLKQVGNRYAMAYTFYQFPPSQSKDEEPVIAIYAIDYLTNLYVNDANGEATLYQTRYAAVLWLLAFGESLGKLRYDLVYRDLDADEEALIGTPGVKAIVDIMEGRNEE